MHTTEDPAVTGQISIPEYSDVQSLKNLYTSQLEALFLHDYKTGGLLDVNEAMLKMYGYNYDEALKINVSDISAGTVPHTVEAVNELFQKVRQIGEVQFEWHDQRKDGSFFWTQNTMRVVRLNGILHIIVTARDISDSKKKQLHLQSLVRSNSNEINELNEKLTLANEELRIINDELEAYKSQLEELVSIRTQELKRSEEKFSKVFHHSPSFIMVSTADTGAMLEVNDTFIRKLGFSSDQLKGKSLASAGLLNRKVHRKILQLIAREGRYNNLEVTLTCKSQEKIHCLASGEIIQLGSTQIMLETFSDISELKRIKERLKLSENRFAYYIEQSAEGVSYLELAEPMDLSLPADKQLGILMNQSILVECNESFASMYGFSSIEEIQNRPIRELFPESMDGNRRVRLLSFIESGYSLSNFETIEKSDDESDMYFIYNAFGVIHNNLLFGIWSSQRNITEIRQATEALRVKNRIEKMIAGLSTGFFNLSPEKVDESINKSLQEICEFLGTDGVHLLDINYSEKSFRIGHNYSTERINPASAYFSHAPLDDLARLIERAGNERILQINAHIDLTDQPLLFHALRKARISEILAVSVLYQGNLVSSLWVSSHKSGKVFGSDEISLLTVAGEIFYTALKRKHSEEVLIESERNYREIFNATNEAIVIHDAISGRIIDANQAAIGILNITNGGIFGDNSNAYASLGKAFADELFSRYLIQVKKEGLAEFEWEVQKNESDPFWVEVSMKTSEIAGDLRIIAVIRDISERKKAAELIRQSEERFRSILQYLTDIVWIVDSQAVILYESPSSSAVLGYPQGYLIGKLGNRLIHPDDLERVMKDFQEVLHHENDYQPTAFRAKHADGKWVLLETIANNMLNHPAIRGIILTCRDITERTETQKAIRATEEKFRNIFNNSSDAIVIIGNKYRILEVNEVFLKLTGYSLHDTSRMKMTDIVTDVFLPSLADRLKIQMGSEHQRAIECEIRGKDRQIIPVEINSKKIEYEGNTAIVSVIRDITERKQMEKKIMDTILNTEEKEREKFARNLHDELGPLLSSIKMYVNSLSGTSDPDKQAFVMTQLKNILSEAIQSTKELSNDLSPHVLVNYGLLAALDWFIRQISPYIHVSFETNLRDERFSGPLETSVYRIIKELINNTIKHAQADSIVLKIHIILKNLHIHYSDNGQGLPGNWTDEPEALGMGISNIKSRCRSINARCRFHNHSPCGMSFDMEVSLPDHVIA